MDIIFFIREFLASIFYWFFALPPLIQLTIGIIFIFSLWSKTAKVLFWLLYPILPSIYMSFGFFNSLGVVKEESDYMYSIMIGGIIGVIFGFRLAVYTFRSGRISIMKTLIKIFLIPVSELVLVVVLLLGVGSIMAFIENPVVTILCILILTAPFSYGASGIVILILGS